MSCPPHVVHRFLRLRAFDHPDSNDLFADIDLNDLFALQSNALGQGAALPGDSSRISYPGMSVIALTTGVVPPALHSD
jgi:hypothetical protein